MDFTFATENFQHTIFTITFSDNVCHLKIISSYMSLIPSYFFVSDNACVSCHNYKNESKVSHLKSIKRYSFLAYGNLNLI